MALASRYISQMETNEPRVVMIGPGYGLEINGGRVLTALHVAEKIDYPIIYQNPAKDIAIIATAHTNQYRTRFTCSMDDYIFIGSVPKPGDSGMPYTIDNKVYGVIIGESGGQGLVATLDESIIEIIKTDWRTDYEKNKEKRLERWLKAVCLS